MTRRAIAALALALTLAGNASAQQITTPLPPLPTVRIDAGMYLIQAELAHTAETLQRGLMFRRDMPPNQGMLFVFPSTGTQCMWMRNTLLPLSVAFVADDGTIVNVEDMAPQTEVSHCSAKPVRYALEMNQGWFAKRGLGAGTRLGGIPPRQP